jgi:hypothetical protein
MILVTKLSCSLEVASFAVTQEIPNILWNPKVHYRAHKKITLVAILSQINPIHVILSYLSMILLNIIHPLMSWFS